MTGSRKSREEPIVLLIDGDCLLCHGAARFVIKRDGAKRFRFAPIQSPVGQRLLSQCGMIADDQATFFLIQGGRAYTKSAAALSVFRNLGGFWTMLYAGIAVPVFLRDRVYDWIAGRRYRWFGKSETCMLPSAELRTRLLDEERRI